jgi:hypothetical protein
MLVIYIITIFWNTAPLFEYILVYQIHGFSKLYSFFLRGRNSLLFSKDGESIFFLTFLRVY